MTKISDCKYDITEHSPDWHSRYNRIVEKYINFIEKKEPSAISALSEDDCISLAINLAKIDPEIADITWSELSSRLDTLTSISIPDEETLSIKVFLSFLNVSSAEAGILFKSSQYTWADPEHICFTVIKIPHDALRSKADISRLELRGIAIIRRRVKAAYHDHQWQRLKTQGKWMQSIIQWLRMKASKASGEVAGFWL